MVLWNNVHSEKVCSSPKGKKGSRPGGSPNSLGKNEHSRKALWSRENHTFEGGSTVFILFHFLPFSFIAFSFPFIFFPFLSLYFIVFPIFFLFFSSGSSFSRVLKIFFCLDCLTISYSSPCVKTIFWAVSGGNSVGQFFSCLFFHFFIFVFFFNFFPCFSFFFPFFLFFLVLFSFLGCSKSFFCLDCLTISCSSPYAKTIFSGPSRGVTPLGNFFSCLFFHFFLLFSFSISFHACPFSIFPFFHFFLFFFLFSGAQNLFLPRLPYDFLFKPLCKNNFLGRLGG